MAKFNVIYCDPPYQYRNKRTGGSMKSGSAAKYPTLSIEDICDLPVSDVADRDSVLFLWVTVPLLPDGFRILDAWGFRYKTTLFWRKVMSLGMGFWFRGQVELCLMGVKGKVKAFRCQRPNFIQSKVRKHSQKPEDFRTLIEEATQEMPDRRYLELFATQKVEGWTCLGFETDGMDIRESLRKVI